MTTAVSGGGRISANIDFAIPALLIIGAGVALILYQHTFHTGIVLNALGQRSNAEVTAGLQGSAEGGGSVYSNGSLTSPATGIWTPIGPGPNLRVFPYLAKGYGNA